MREAAPGAFIDTAIEGEKGGGAMNKFTRIVLILIVTSIAAVVTKRVGDWAEGRRAPGIVSPTEEGFRLAVAEMKPTLPKKIDDVTTLTDVASAGLVMTYYYQVDSAARPDFVELMRKNVAETVCKTDLKKFMQAGAIYRYSYSDAQAKALGTFDLTAADCPAS